MDYITDRPIDTAENDLLGRSFFSKQLGETIYKYNGKDGLVIGLFGEWGTGKTSIVNMAIEEINELAKNDENKPIIMEFPVWNYSDKNNLIHLFLQNLEKQIETKNKNKYSFLKKLDNKIDTESININKLLKTYAKKINSNNYLDTLSHMPKIGFISKMIQSYATDDLNKIKKEIEKTLIEKNKKIIVIIDDIDRLTYSQIKDIFQLVKQVADFPNIIYLLSMDRGIVSNILSDMQKTDGNKYLEKIIQVPFEIPKLRKSNLNEIFFKKLDQIIDNICKKNNIHKKRIFDEDDENYKNYWGSVFRNCIDPYLKTLRDVNRVINVFQFRYAKVYSETSFVDMLAITTLEVLEPKLYDWIVNNKNIVCNGFKHENKPNYYNEFKELGINNPDLAINCVSTIFPAFAKNTNVGHSYSKTKEYMRVADEKRFNLYFMFDLDDIKVSRSIINACIYEFDKNKLSAVIQEINKQGHIIYFIEEVESLLDNIPYERLSSIIFVMLDLSGEFIGEKYNWIFALSVHDTAIYLAMDMIKKLNTEREKYDVIRLAVENVRKNSLGTMAYIVNTIELAYGRLAGDSEKQDDQFISLEHLEELEKIYAKRVSNVDLETIFDIDKFHLAFYLWKCFDKEKAENCLQKSFENEINKLKFICAAAGRWSGTNGTGWNFNSTVNMEYISKDEIDNIIQNLDKTKLDDQFSEMEQIKLASFVLNNKHDNIRDLVNEEGARKLVSEWKTGK